jgi:hypothetical protein
MLMILIQTVVATIAELTLAVSPLLLLVIVAKYAGRKSC